MNDTGTDTNTDTNTDIDTHTHTGADTGTGTGTRAHLASVAGDIVSFPSHAELVRTLIVSARFATLTTLTAPSASTVPGSRALATARLAFPEAPLGSSDEIRTAVVGLVQAARAIGGVA